MIKDRIRTLLNIRVRRGTAPVGSKPRAGRRITLGRLRMQVTSPPTDDLWLFLALQGWREVTVARDRRRYVDLPRESLDVLGRSHGTDRETRYQRLLAQANRAGAQVLGARTNRPRPSVS